MSRYCHAAARRVSDPCAEFVRKSSRSPRSRRRKEAGALFRAPRCNGPPPYVVGYDSGAPTRTLKYAGVAGLDAVAAGKPTLAITGASAFIPAVILLLNSRLTLLSGSRTGRSF